MTSSLLVLHQPTTLRSHPLYTTYTFRNKATTSAELLLKWMLSENDVSSAPDNRRILAGQLEYHIDIHKHD